IGRIQPGWPPKPLEIYKELSPHATRLGVLGDARAPSYRPVLQALEPASKTLGVQLKMIPVSAAEDFDGALAAMAGERCDGVIVHASTLTSRSHSALLAELALKHRLPTIFGTRENVVTGGLMSYAPDHIDLT